MMRVLMDFRVAKRGEKASSPKLSLKAMTGATTPTLKPHRGRTFVAQVYTQDVFYLVYARRGNVGSALLEPWGAGGAATAG
ncbi:hypothetical protein J6590_021126 [Homalodisca vitripennis]|nr:hypothetical protein J6590_021126 [Homalodisca vitripennis]